MRYYGAWGTKQEVKHYEQPVKAVLDCLDQTMRRWCVYSYSHNAIRASAAHSLYLNVFNICVGEDV